ncbi:MAG: DUF4912 domain-containing protein [Treponema sp.]|jgi:hypothetical protein|nr:DUF4912 domain-containing protein [Treponema sp.]
MMEESHLTRPYLESLSADELVKLADSFAIDIPYGLERIFIIEELLALSSGDEFVSEDDMEDSPDFTEAADLPRRYNISYMEVMIRDPLWAFVFWEVKEHDKELHEKTPDFGGYRLKVIPLTADDGRASRPKRASMTDRENFFTVPVGVDDAAWYLGFPPAEGRYMVELCALQGEKEIALIFSRPFKMPRLLEPSSRKVGLPEDLQDIYRNPLACLSGARDFALIRNADRQSRDKRKGVLR